MNYHSCPASYLAGSASWQGARMVLGVGGGGDHFGGRVRNHSDLDSFFPLPQALLLRPLGHTRW